MLNKSFARLYRVFSTRDTKSIEIYFELMNAWWLFILWHPATNLSFSLTAPYKDALIALVAGAAVLAIIALLSGKKTLRVMVLLIYVAFYFLTGLNLFIDSYPFINPLGGIFICQGLLAIFLTWKIQARMGNRSIDTDVKPSTKELLLDSEGRRD